MNSTEKTIKQVCIRRGSITLRRQNYRKLKQVFFCVYFNNTNIIALKLYWLFARNKKLDFYKLQIIHVINIKINSKLVCVLQILGFVDIFFLTSVYLPLLEQNNTYLWNKLVELVISVSWNFYRLYEMGCAMCMCNVCWIWNDVLIYFPTNTLWYNKSASKVYFKSN